MDLINLIITDIASGFNINKWAMFTSSRKRNVTDARFVCCYFLHRKLKRSSNETGRFFGISHATVLHACKNVDLWVDDCRVNPMATEIIKQINDKYKL